jgi:hypothetical protein
MIPRHLPWEDCADFTVGLARISEADWLEGGEADPAARKDPLFGARRALVWGETPGSLEAQLEAAELVADALGGPAPASDWPPLYAAARRVPDDLCLMEWRDGAWRLTALSLSAPTFFSADQVLGKSLADLHTPVTGFSDRFLARVERIFDGLRPGLTLQRRNWTVVNSAEPFTPRAAPIRARIPQIDPAAAGRELHLRVERQTLRRLPRTGGALFTIRVWLDPLDSLATDPMRLAAFAKAWREAAADFRAYKRFELYEGLVEGFLRAHGETYSVNRN